METETETGTEIKTETDTKTAIKTETQAEVAFYLNVPQTFKPEQNVNFKAEQTL